MRHCDDENQDQLNAEESCCDHGGDFEGFEPNAPVHTTDHPDCRHEKVQPVMSWKQEGAREMTFRFFCLKCRIQFERTIQPEERRCSRCGESYFYYPYVLQ